PLSLSCFSSSLSFWGQKHTSEFENSHLSLSCFSSSLSFLGHKHTPEFENSEYELLNSKSFIRNT
ncbi:hypothetical protein LINPERHAP2_LOCUS7974, partial [Linum perenne]